MNVTDPPVLKQRLIRSFYELKSSPYRKSIVSVICKSKSTFSFLFPAEGRFYQVAKLMKIDEGR